MLVTIEDNPTSRRGYVGYRFCWTSLGGEKVRKFSAFIGINEKTHDDKGTPKGIRRVGRDIVPTLATVTWYVPVVAGMNETQARESDEERKHCHKNDYAARGRVPLVIYRLKRPLFRHGGL